jgi:peptide/nickel transport system substrate-binding protein
MSIMYTAFEPTTTKLIQAVADQLSKVGITVQLKADADFASLGADLGSKQYAGVSLTWGGQTQFVNTNELWQKASALNPLGNEVDGLASAFTSYAASTAADRESSAQAVQKVLVDQAVSVPVALVDTIWIASPKLKGFTLDPTGNANNPADWSIG